MSEATERVSASPGRSLRSCGMPQLSSLLAEFVARTRYEDVPPRARAMAKLCLLDAIGVSLAASRLGEGCKAFVDMAMAQEGRALCTIFGLPRRVPPEAAALANGALAHALDYEDSHDVALVHPNAPTVPAALAIAQAEGPTTGRELIAAIALGCDIAVRLSLALRVSLAEFGWYPPPILAAFGATAAAAALLHLDAQQVRDAFSLTLCQATCSNEIIHSPRSTIRAVRDAFVARAAVTSALLARGGVRGFDEPFEGRAGFFAAFARGAYDPDAITRELGARFEIEHISFKPWPSCRGTHAAIEAALQCRQQHELDPRDIEHVQVSGGPMLRMLGEPSESKRRPATAIDAKFSLPFTVATALVRGHVTLADFLPQALLDQEVLHLAARVDVDTGRDLAGAPIAAAVQVKLRDGRTPSHAVLEPWGSPIHPMTPLALVDKFVDCAAQAATPMDELVARRFADATLDLDSIADIDRDWLELPAIRTSYRR